jgi:PAS domain S-box-containing protein
MATELERIGQVVGKEGKIDQRGSIGDADGSWAKAVNSVNALILDLVYPTSEMARVIGAVANGDLSQTMELETDGRPLQGQFLRTARTVNAMVKQLSAFASEVTRVAREVGTEGNLGGQARVRGVAGTWKDLTENVNSMASNLTSQVRNIAAVTTAVAEGDLSKKITVDVKGEILELKNTINTMVDQLRSFASEVTRVAREVGTEGKLGGQATVKGVAGTWKDLTDNVNSMASNLTSQVRNIAGVTTAVAKGDLSKKITVQVEGEILELKNTINTMVDQLRSFASEVTRVAREVGTEGKLGGQAEVRGLAGTWKDLTDNVNLMAGDLTSQVRGIARVVTAVAQGNLKQKLTVAAEGEIAALADTINGMIDTLATFADQVTSVARAVGVEGELGGQANVPGAAGTWKDLTDNVNRLAANLTTQVRAIAEVATAVAHGDLTRSIQVQARGEVAALKDNINEMIRNLRETTSKNCEQDWLKTNLAKFSRMLQGQKELWAVGEHILSELAPVIAAQQAVFYVMDATQKEPCLKLLASYAYRGRRHIRFKLGEGLVGQCAAQKEKILLSKVPKRYLKIGSGLGAATPLNIIVLPVLFEGRVKGVIELASFERFHATHLTLLDQLMESIGIVINTIEANMRTEDLLEQSQAQAERLRQSEERFRLLMEGVKDYAIYMLDEQGRVASWNVGAEQITGYRAQEIIGQHSSRFFPREEAGRGHRDRELKLTALEGRFEDEGWRVRKNGTRFWANVITTALRDEEGKLRGYAEVIRDITGRKLLEREILEISDREQRRIGQDLHDDLCQQLTGIEMMSQYLEQNLAARSMSETATAVEITKLVRKAISHTRDLARGLSPVMLESDGLLSALQELAANTEKVFKISCQFQGDASIQISDNTVATHLYRIAQEALSNAAKHGKATRVVISLVKVHDRILLTIKDNGVGLPKTARTSKGMGLRIMGYRAGMIGGSLTVQRQTDGGTRVACGLKISNHHLPPRR